MREGEAMPMITTKMARN